jgi:hypothetical protein
MRRFFLTALLSLGLCPAAAADPPNAQAAYVERQGLLEIDQRCRLLEPGPRTALQAGAAQARGALLRAGWTPARVSELHTAVREAARRRACDDARTRTAVTEARTAYATWATATVMEFPGWERAWTARRSVGPNGWRLSQPISAPVSAVFGVRELHDAQRLSFIVPGTEPANAQLSFRDAARTNSSSLDLSGRIAFGLEAGAPRLGTLTRDFSATRSVERITATSRMQTVYTFPDGAFAALLQLDPRESVVIRLGAGRDARVFYVEVGDVAAARSFLTLRAG